MIGISVITNTLRWLSVQSKEIDMKRSTYNRPKAVHMIRRRHLVLPNIWHIGVAFEFEKPEYLNIVELQREGLLGSTLYEFANDRTVEILHTIQHPRLIDDAVRRLIHSIYGAETINYDAIFQNCEHFARYIVEGKPQSIQVQKLVSLGILTAAIVILKRSYECYA